ncbi:putative ribonuclease-like protein YfkH [Virgibacillus pantothenticus]|uniref:Ribonuclease n=1 Tax=Virgibacillus pantothenticus TaxID=1473 RepID=A0A0L0QVA6_VIRPA|nr:MULTISPECIES: YihY/virulence factor BrkB family protein [Virgibacillus]API91312.1 ribonuclease [Virgibacillus sp. 6R]KNE22501.1 ribonuclease [Virgibacillus pantothenticus]MBS7426545.1 YihY/virulence factor BrkB family protein [Virgibacillus sp. 19R1-5]MBU8567270.1 YihY/virulence factor BrkB family protein [Virgibacillus pantothenticus]MBU8600026.1 YihY/virulence factor BrkB family protein [Virgibacillus pantothenticus]
MVNKVILFGKQVYQRMIDIDLFGLAAQLAFFFLLSLFPFLLFLVTLVGYLPMDELAVLDIISSYAPPQIVELISTNVTNLIRQRNGGLLSFGIIATLWAASNGVNALMRGFNYAYEVDENRSFIVSRLIAIVLTIAMMAIIIIALLLPIFGKLVGTYLFSFVGLSEGFITVWEALRWVVSSIVFFIVFLALYKLAPNKRIYLKNAAAGALFATVAWQLVSLGFSYYVSNIGNYSAMYGSLGAVIALMIWFYLSGIIILTGGLINAIIRKNKLMK